MKKEELQQFLNQNIEAIFADRFSNYSKYIIQDRALPDVRDGLKPVQRRIIYAMHTDHNTYDKQYRKSAKTVGNVIGNYHPHGDTSVYEAMVRMSQEWKVRAQLIDMHGNNGSIDGDRAAAMRYTEARLSEYSNLLMQDIELNTVDKIPNFDDTLLEPVVLPNKIPNLLINGASGISAGYATEIPPHNLGEIVDATLALNEDPTLQVAQLVKIVPGPDFPTGGEIYVPNIKGIYERGQGQIKMRAKAKITADEILITEIPYDVNKAVLVAKIDQIRVNGGVPGISEVIDQSDQHGLTISIKLKAEANSEVIWKYLLKNTSLQQNFNFNMIAINNRRPELMGIKEILMAFLKHRDQVIQRRSVFKLEKAKTRLHIVEGLRVAIVDLDEVVRIIRGSKDKTDAMRNLEKALKIDELQSEAVVTMQLYRLTNTDITILIKEQNELLQTIERLTEVLQNDNVRREIITEELKEIKENFATPRKSKIIKKEANLEIDKKELVNKENIVLLITEEGYTKRSTLRSYLSSTTNPEILKDDKIKKVLYTHSQAKIMIVFTNGKFISSYAFEIEDTKWKEKLKHVSSYFKIDDGIKVLDMLVIEEKPTSKILTLTEKGYISKVETKLIDEFALNRISVLQNVKADDKVVKVILSETDDKIIFLANNDEYIIKDSKEFESGSLKRRGILVTRLKKNQKFINMALGKEFILISDKGGYFKIAIKDLIEKNTFDLLFTNQKSNPHNVIYLENTKVSKLNLILDTEMWYNVNVDKLKKLLVLSKFKTIIKENVNSVQIGEEENIKKGE